MASSLIEGNQDISTGLEWIRTWALQVAEADPDTECTSVSTAIITGRLYFFFVETFWEVIYHLILFCSLAYSTPFSPIIMVHRYSNTTSKQVKGKCNIEFECCGLCF